MTASFVKYVSSFIHQSKKEMETLTANCELQFKPVDFIRAHSIDNNKSDIQTEIWQSAFQPDLEKPGKYTSWLATCGGNSVCITDVEKSTVKYKFKAEIGERLFALAWGTSLSHSANSLLAVGGTGLRIYFITPKESAVEASQLAFDRRAGGKRSTINSSINSLLFHPNQLDILFCGYNTSTTREILITQFSPSRLSDVKVLHKLSCPDDVIQTTFHLPTCTLFVAHNEGLHAWDLNCNLTTIDDERSAGFAVELPQPLNKVTGMLYSDPETMVDTVLSLTGTSLVACKIYTTGYIIVFDTKDAELKNNQLKPKSFQLLEWADSDDAYLYLGWEPERKILGCGDSTGGVWLYKLANLELTSNIKTSTSPSAVLMWPEKISDEHVEKERKLKVGTYNILVTQVSLNRNYVVSVTRTNFICIWRETDGKKRKLESP